MDIFLKKKRKGRGSSTIFFSLKIISLKKGRTLKKHEKIRDARALE